MHVVNLIDVAVEDEQAVVVNLRDGLLVYARIPSSQKLNGSGRKASCRTPEDTPLFGHPSYSSHKSKFVLHSCVPKGLCQWWRGAGRPR
jgi:hypothetical protein